MLRFDIYVGTDFQGNLSKSKIGKIDKIKVYGYDEEIKYEDIYIDLLKLTNEVDSGVEYHYVDIPLNEYIDNLESKDISYIEFIDQEFILKYSIDWKEVGIAGTPVFKKKSFRTDEGPGDANNNYGYNEYPEWEGIQYNETIINSYNEPINIVSNQIVVDYYDEYIDNGWGSGGLENSGYGFGKIDVYSKLYNSNILRIEIYDDSSIKWIGDDKNNSYILDFKLRVNYE